MIDDANLLDRYLHSRRTTERLCAPLVTADYVVQAMPDAEIVALGQTPGARPLRLPRLMSRG